MSWMFDPITFWLVVTRLSGWMISSPGFTEINTPQVTRAMLIVWLAVLMLPMVQGANIVVTSIPELMMLTATEFMIGAGYGLVLRCVFAAIYFGGTMIDSELGLLAAQQLNPFAPQNSGVFSRLFLLIGILYFFLEGYFRVVIAALYESFELVPLGLLTQPKFEIEDFIRLGAGIFIGGLVFSAPIIAMMFFVNIAIGFLARTVQGLNVFAESFTLKVGIGLFAVVTFLHLLFRFTKIQLETLIPLSSQYFQRLAPPGSL